MYTGYFGLTESPFSIAPNPDFLFMSERHREALAHLSYGLGETGGFVLLTGEVGTGKTTVSRCILEKLPDNTQAAFILNPTLSAQELLATICDELNVRYRKTGATLKTLTDKIQQKLLSNHEQGINTILLIDEAQHLRPEVLEQLRLLTNLETNTKKLLQVILIGQPELQQLLKRQDLRQLAQRITARYHLLPLSLKEVQQYIVHRLEVAGCQQELFTNKAVKQIHLLSKGVPRLINLLCDRALLGAYASHQTQVDVKLVNGASKEALGEEHQPKPWYVNPVIKYSAASLLIAGVLFGGYVIGRGEQALTQLEEQAVSSQQTNTPAEKEVSLVTQESAHEQVDLLAVIEDSRSLPLAFNELFKLWQIEFETELEQPCQSAQDFGLQCHWQQGTLSSLRRLGHGAILKFIDENGESFFGTYMPQPINDESKSFELVFNSHSYPVTNIWVERYWQGSAVILWQAPDGFDNQISSSSNIAAIQWLENQLSFHQSRPARVLESFDVRLLNQLHQFQRQHALEVSDVADIKTVLLLSRS